MAIAIFLLIPLLLFGESLVPEKDWISDSQARLALARILAKKDATKQEALIQYERLLLDKPKEIEFYLEMARLYHSLDRTSEGLELLYSALDTHPEELDLILATAQMEADMGHAMKSRELFLKALCLSDKDSLRLAYAAAMMSWGDFYKAESIYREFNKPLELEWALASQRRFSEAEEVLLSLDENSKVKEAFAKLKLQERKFEEALFYAEDEALQADILYQAGNYEEALELYEKLDNFVGIGKIYLKGECEEAAKQAFEKSTSLEAGYYLGKEPPNQAKDLALYARLNVERGMAGIGLEYYRNAVALDPDYFPGWIGLAETLSTAEEYEEAIKIYSTLLESFPDNYKLMIALARVIGWSKDYESSLAWYDKMLEMNPEDPVLYKEKARTALWDNQYILAMQTYGDIEELQIEKEAKRYYWNKHYLHALCIFAQLTDKDPGDEEALFDTAQLNCILGLCHCSNEIYDEILNMDPNHKLAKLGLYLNEMKTHTALRGFFSYWREIGSGSFSQSQIARYRFDAIIEEPLSCNSNLRLIQNTWVENPFFNFKFYPAEGETIEADAVFNPYARGLISVTYKNYFGKFKSRITSHNIFSFNICDYFQLTLGCDKENEIYNFFSLKQATQSTIASVMVNSNLTHYWNMEASFRNLHYNDHNNQVHVNINTHYALTDGPTVFQIIINGNYRNTSDNSISIVEGTQLIDVIHPYWTPQRYFSGAITLQIHQDYRDTLICEAPQRYFELKVTTENDSEDNPSIQGIIEWRHEWVCSGFELKAFIHRSPEWNAEGVWASFFYRF